MEFWENVGKFVKFFISSMIGLILILIQPVIRLYKEVPNKIFVFLFLGLFISGIGFTLKEMLAID
ncbi:unnamed protein product [Chrysoparadoxa australica]